MTGQTDVDRRRHDRPGLPLGRTSHAREKAARSLPAPAASYVTGDSCVVDGGTRPMGTKAGTERADDRRRKG
jgi:hypothetical protein